MPIPHIPHKKIQSVFILANAQSITCLACFAVPLVHLWAERNKWSLYAALVILGKIFRSQADHTHPLPLQFNKMSFCPPQALVQTTDVCSSFCHLLLFPFSSDCTPLFTPSCSALVSVPSSISVDRGCRCFKQHCCLVKTGWSLFFFSYEADMDLWGCNTPAYAGPVCRLETWL